MVKSNNKKVAAKIVKLKKPSKARSLTKELMERAVRHIAEEILAAKPTADQRTPRGFADKLLKEAKETFPKLSMNKINYAIKKMKEGLKKGALSLSSSLSSLTNDTSAGNPTSNSTSAGTEPTSNSTVGSSNASVESSSSNEWSDNDSAPKKTTTAAEKLQSKSCQVLKEKLKLLIPGDTGNSIGRPKGTTDTNSRQLLEKVEEATQEVVNKFKEVKSKTRSSKHRLQKGSLKIIIASAKEKFNIPHDIIISENTVRQRVKRGSKSGHVGQSSPMLELEPYLVELIKKLADMRTPVTTAQGLELANSLIEGKSTQKQLIDWKSKNCHAYKMKGTVKLGKSYWRNFLRRNSH
jgi:hypothetical protein